MMNTEELPETFERIRDELGADTLLSELYNAMTTDEVEDNLNYIARMWDIEL